MQSQKVSTLTNLLNLLFVYIQGSHTLRKSFFPNKPHTQNYLTLQFKWAREESNSAFRGRNSTKFCIIIMQTSSLFIHITNFLKTSTIP